MSRTQIPPDFPVFQQVGNQILPSHLAKGPWYPGTQHGSAMLLLAAMAVEQVPSAVPRQVTRLTVDMLSAAPLAPIDLVTHLRRSGRNLEALDISICSEGQEYVRASALRYGIADVPVADRLKCDGNTPVLPQPPRQPFFAQMQDQEGFHNAIEIRIDLKAQPAVMWFRLKHPVLPGQPITPLQRVALASDWTYSVPSFSHHILTGEAFDAQPFYGINPDTTINLHRPAAGEWVGIQTHASYSDLGAGTVMGQLFDETGAIGFCTQSILVRRRASPATGNSAP